MAKNSVSIGTLFQNTINFFSRKPNNAIRVSRAKQYSGEWSKELPYTRYYEHYHGVPSVKRNINSIHKRWMGSMIEVTSDNPTFDFLWKSWSSVTHFIPKLKVFALDTLITGVGLFEKQFWGSTFANIEHIPTKTLWKMYRDEFAEKLSIWQMIDGDIKELAPDNIAVFTINNPENDAVGKSAMYALAVPQKVSGKLDELGIPINADRYLPSILDTKMRLNYAHMEEAEKKAKQRFFVSIKGMKDKVRQEEIENDLENESSSTFVTVTDGDVTVSPMQFNKDVANERYLDDIDKQINQGSGFPGDVIDKGGEMGYASSQTPVQDLSMSIEDMQNDLSSFIEDQIFAPLCEQWGLDFNTVQPKLIFNTFVEKITFEQLIKIPVTAPLAETELRSAYKEFMPGMNDQEWESFKEEKKQNEEDQMKMKASTKAESMNPRPEIEKERPKPESTAENHPMLRNPKLLDDFIKASTKKAVELSMPHMFAPKGRTYPENCQCIYCGLEKLDMVHNVTGQSTEALSYIAMPPIDGKPYESPYPEITNTETLIRIKQMLEDVKSGKLKEEDLTEEIDRISKEADSISYWIKELTDKHKDWHHDQVVAVAIKKSKEVSNQTSKIEKTIEQFNKNTGGMEKMFDSLNEKATKQYKIALETMRSELETIKVNFDSKLAKEIESNSTDKKKIKSLETKLSSIVDSLDTKSVELDPLQKKKDTIIKIRKKLEKMDEE
jgi:hypothetical protein